MLAHNVQLQTKIITESTGSIVTRDTPKMVWWVLDFGFNSPNKKHLIIIDAW